MIIVYGGWPTRAFRVAWALEELGVAYRVRPVDLRQRQSDEEFMAKNPAGFLPVLEDDGVVMVESIAMLEYLVAKHDKAHALAPSADDRRFPLYLQFLHLGEAGLAAYLNIVVASRLFGPEAERNNFGAQVAERMFFSRLGLVARRLATAPMMAGETFSAADISVVYALDIAERLGLADNFSPEIVNYRSRMSARPGYKAADEKTRQAAALAGAG